MILPDDNYDICLDFCFEAVSGFRINMDKGELIPENDVPKIEILAADMDLW